MKILVKLISSDWWKTSLNIWNARCSSTQLVRCETFPRAKSVYGDWALVQKLHPKKHGIHSKCQIHLSAVWNMNAKKLDWMFWIRRMFRVTARHFKHSLMKIDNRSTISKKKALIGKAFFFEGCRFKERLRCCGFETEAESKNEISCQMQKPNDQCAN